MSLRYLDDGLAVEFTDALLRKNLLTEAQLGELQSRAMLTGKNPAQLIAEENKIPEDTLLSTYAELSGIPYKNIAEFKIPPEATNLVAAKVALRHHIIPVQYENTILTLATSRVPTLQMVDGLRMLLDTPLDWVLINEADLSRTLTHFYGLGAETIDQLILEADESDNEDVDIATKTEETGMVRFINLIIAEAIRMDASDIHLEPFERSLRLRYRIDGILQEIPLPKGVERLKRSVSSAIKIMANADIAERRKPHDGRIKIRANNNEYDLRVSILPACWGETCCLRILNRGSTRVDLDHLGLSHNALPKIEKLCELPHGVILLTGPTGSGKTTTLYALLARINTGEQKIITVEDPIEYQMSGIDQVQVHAKIDLTFASILRNILRHDPDVILIGEIRDGETADIAVRSSLTGHLVLSTLHTNDAPSAVTRLTDMGIEPYLISSCVEGVIAQRLLRRVCPMCRDPFTPPPEILAEITALYPEKAATSNYVKGHGCPNCAFTGYRGRTAITEVMLMSDALRSLVIARNPANIIKQQALSDGMTTLRQDGWLRVVDGRTSVDEILRVTGREG